MIDTQSNPELDLAQLRAHLLGERDRLKQLVGAVTGTLSLAQDDDASSAKLRTRLAAITKAIGRIDGGSYGRCAGCDNSISPSRLATSPTVTHCLGCEMTGAVAN